MSFEPKQIEMVCLEDLVLENHIYRKFLNLWNMDSVRLELEKLETESDHKGYGIYRIFLCLLLQFLEDLSDRELERFICGNNAAHLISKVGLWKERDKAIELKLESLNNKTLEKVSADKDAKFGAKSKDKIWYGYKQHTSVDMQFAAVKKNNMKNKNRDLDSYYTKVRAPFERVFSKQNKRVRYKGIAKNQFTAFMQAITFNFKRLTILTASAPPITT
jgi:IS5 family transposase